jgi:(p)ppGpp synthase/HD superfamily hydrolase
MPPVLTGAPHIEVTEADAMRFLADAYDGVAVRPGKGLPHAQAVCAIVREAGHDERIQVVALLHDVLEDTPRTREDVRARFGAEVASMVAALTEDPAIKRYAARKRDLRARAVAAGAPVLDVALADKIASLRTAARTGAAVSAHKLSHYRATLQLGRGAGASAMLCAQLEDLLRAPALA